MPPLGTDVITSFHARAPRGHRCQAIHEHAAATFTRNQLPECGRAAPEARSAGGPLRLSLQFAKNRTRLMAAGYCTARSRLACSNGDRYMRCPQGKLTVTGVADGHFNRGTKVWVESRREEPTPMRLKLLQVPGAQFRLDAGQSKRELVAATANVGVQGGIEAKTTDRQLSVGGQFINTPHGRDAHDPYEGVRTLQANTSAAMASKVALSTPGLRSPGQMAGADLLNVPRWEEPRSLLAPRTLPFPSLAPSDWAPSRRPSSARATRTSRLYSPTLLSTPCVPRD
jgi:hypothetical protein